MSYIMEKIKTMRNSLHKKYGKEDCNVIYHDTSDVTDILKSSIGDKAYRIATAGYSAPQEGYEDLTAKFLSALNKRLKSGKTGYITTPALQTGSIYDITTQVSGLNSKNVAFFTTEEYWENTDLSSFRKDLNMKKYSQVPIHVFPDTRTYAEATANASNILICTGGRGVAVTEIVEALKRKSKVVILINENLKNAGIDRESEQVECASKYFWNIIGDCQKDIPEVSQLDLDFLRTHPGRENQLVRYYFVRNDEEAERSALVASDFIGGKTLYDFWPDKADDIDKMVGHVQRRKDEETAFEHYLKTGKYKRLYE